MVQRFFKRFIFCRRIPFKTMIPTDKKFKFSLMHLQYISSIILAVALGLGLYNQWQYSEDPVILIIALLGLFVFGISCALQYYFNFQTVGQALLHIWLGCILGIIIFTNKKEIEYVTTQEVMDILLITSVVVGCFWTVAERVFHVTKHEPVMFSSIEVLESLGLIIATLITGKDAIPIILLIVAFEFNLVAIRMKSLIGLLSLISLIVLSVIFFFKDLNLSINFYGLICFLGRHSIQPIIELYFSSFSTLERWQTFFNQSKILRHFIMVLIFTLNLSVGALIGQQTTNHKEWFVVVPMFIVFAVFWLCFHTVSFITCWRLMSKITDCNITFKSISDERKSMNRIMSSKGVRYFGLISQRLICLTLISTLILGALGWTTRTGYSLGLFLIVIPIESMTLTLFWELGDYLGGTAIGYAIIAPVIGQRTPQTGATLLSAGSIQDIGSRGASTLNKISQFFNFHMIDNYGCDFSTSGLALDYLESKVKAFFDRRMSDGPRYDTYILFYSGEVYENGDWALADNRNLKFDTLLEWWSSKNEDSGTRLILILDTTHSYTWAKEVQYIRGEYVAVQTCRFSKPSDPEFGHRCSVGAFTQDWVHYNLEAEIDPEWSDKDRSIKAVYKVSKNWTNFTFHLPTKEDTACHWEGNFPKITHPLLRLVNFGRTGSVCCCCECICQCIRRKRMKWLPPKELDTGHGFKLIRS